MDGEDGRALPETGRNETATERADRQWQELIQEIRVAQTRGADPARFLLTVVFTPRFQELRQTDRTIYVTAVIPGSLATGALTGPVSFHRIVSGRPIKPQAVAWDSRLIFTGILVPWLVAGVLAWYLLFVRRITLRKRPNGDKRRGAPDKIPLWGHTAGSRSRIPGRPLRRSTMLSGFARAGLAGRVAANQLVGTAVVGEAVDATDGQRGDQQDASADRAGLLQRSALSVHGRTALSGRPPSKSRSSLETGTENHSASRSEDVMIVLGIILLVVGYVVGIAILSTIGIILVVVGVILWILGAVGHQVGGRRHYW